MTQEKICTTCNKSFPLELKYFKPNKRLLSGFYSDCRECTNKKVREYRSSAKYKAKVKKDKEENPEKYEKLRIHLLAKRAERKRTDPDFKETLRLAAMKNYYTPERQAYLKKQRKSKKFIEQRKINDKNWRDNNLEKARAKSRKRRSDNLERARKEGRQYSAALGDGYIKNLIRKQNPLLDKQDIPPEMIETKRLIININREIKKWNQ